MMRQGEGGKDRMGSMTEEGRTAEQRQKRQMRRNEKMRKQFPCAQKSHRTPPGLSPDRDKVLCFGKKSQREHYTI